jgi:hypothetical protein
VIVFIFKEWTGWTVEIFKTPPPIMQMQKESSGDEIKKKATVYRSTRASTPAKTAPTKQSGQSPAADPYWSANLPGHGAYSIGRPVFWGFLLNLPTSWGCF